MSITEEIREERRRQMESEGWSPEHDDSHDTGELADAAATYAMSTLQRKIQFGSSGEPPEFWPFEPSWWKPGDRRRELIKAGALIVAEIERIDRNGEQG